MKSMTCYAYKECSKENITVSVEIKGYNSRFLDLSVFLPSRLSSLEPWVRECITSRFSRGKMDVGIKVKEEGAPVSITVNENAAMTYKKALCELAKNLGLNEEPSLRMILGLEGVLEIEKDRNVEKFRPLIESVLVEAADQAEAERVREGRHTMEDILSYIAFIEESVKNICSHVPEVEATIKENLQTRFAEFVEGRIDENRVLAEIAVVLMKSTISEELSRLSSHLSEFRLEIERNPSPGKKLDFLSQEINREVNTIGSKTPVIEVSRLVVEMKNALENVREQLRNVE